MRVCEQHDSKHTIDRTLEERIGGVPAAGIIVMIINKKKQILMPGRRRASYAWKNHDIGT